MAAPSLAYPLGPDQGLHAYLGWGILEGQVPYATGGISTKPPLTFAVYAVAFLLFGRTTWAIRVVEVVFLLALAAVATRLIRPPGAPYRPGDFGALALLATTAHFVFFDYWATAHPDLWQGILLVAAASLLADPGVTARRAALAGATSGFAFMLKFNAVVIAVPLAVVALFTAAWSRPVGARARALAQLTASHLAGGLAAVAATLAPFALTGTLPAVYEVLVDFAVLHYLGNETAGPPPSTALRWLGDQGGAFFLGTAAAGIVAGGIRHRRVPGGLTHTVLLAVLLVAAVASVAIQRRWLTYYWTAVTPFAVAGIGWGLHALARRSAVSLALAIGLAVGAWQVQPRWWPEGYAGQARAALALADGTTSAAAYRRRFPGPWGFGWDDAVRAGAWIQREARPGDALCVWAFQPEAYMTTGLRCPSRLQVMPPEFERYGTWRAEYINTLTTARPRFILASSRNPAVKALNYRERERFGALAVYEALP